MSLLTDYIRITRRVTTDLDRTVVVESVTTPFFEVELTPPHPRAAKRAVAPQDFGVFTVRYWKSPVAFWEDSFKAGDRFSARGKEWEVLANASETLVGMQSGVETTQAMPVDMLYPFIGELQKIGGEMIEANIRLALWSPREDHRDTGNFRDFEGQIPIEYHDQLETNQQFLIGTRTYKVMESNINQEQMHLDISVRLAGIHA